MGSVEIIWNVIYGFDLCKYYKKRIGFSVALGVVMRTKENVVILEHGFAGIKSRDWEKTLLIKGMS